MLQNIPFSSADILIPAKNHEAFSTIACDQFTSEPEYWERVSALAKGKASAYHITLPEIYLSGSCEKRIADMWRRMEDYLAGGVFTEYKDALIYVERTLSSGRIRRGLVGKIDLAAYDYSADSKSLIRATEGTVPERIPPRVRIRRDAPLELPHAMLLIDDPAKSVIEPLTGRCLETIYDFDLMTGAGHLRGKLIPKSEHENIFHSISMLATGREPLLFAVGDGNHSLAAAAECYRRNPTDENRYALVEVVNIHDSALLFEPIYRVLFGVNPQEAAAEASDFFARYRSMKENASEMKVISSSFEGAFPCPAFPVEELQEFITKYLSTHEGASVDYIHGEDSLRALARKQGTLGFMFEGIRKDRLFPYIREHGALPRKSFSMGEALDKRFYFEARRIIKQ